MEQYHPMGLQNLLSGQERHGFSFIT
jgi:hypothetical protein